MLYWLSCSISFYILLNFEQCRKISHKGVKSTPCTACKLKYILIRSFWVQFPLRKEIFLPTFLKQQRPRCIKIIFIFFFLIFWRVWESFLLSWVHTLLHCNSLLFRKIHKNKKDKGNRRFWIRYSDKLSYSPHLAPSGFESKEGGTRNNTGVWWGVSMQRDYWRHWR